MKRKSKIEKGEHGKVKEWVSGKVKRQKLSSASQRNDTRKGVNHTQTKKKQTRQIKAKR